MEQIAIALILVLGSCDNNFGIMDSEGSQHAQGLQDNQEGIGQQGLKSDIGRQVLRAHESPQQPQGKIDMQFSTASLALAPGTPGSSPGTPGVSCQALLDAGMTLSGVYWVINPNSADVAQAGAPMRVFCDQDINGGGWALVYNSVLGAATLDFWNIPYAQRLGRRGRPSLDSNYYDGALYQATAAIYADVIEDLRGKTVIAFVAKTAGINNVNMRFGNPILVSGNLDVFNNQFASGWSAPDFDGDVDSSLNCATSFNNITQHYGFCWNYNLGSDADLSGGDITDQRLGPHVNNVVLANLGLAGDGSSFGRVRAIRRYVKW